LPSFDRLTHRLAIALLALGLQGTGMAWAQSLQVSQAPGASTDPVFTLDGLPRPSAPPLERGPVLPAHVERWRQMAKAMEYGEPGIPRDPVQAAELYCRASRHGDAESQYNLAWMLTNSRGIERDEAQAAHLFGAAAEQGYVQARNILARMGPPRGEPPACLAFT
jgi:TPR repeat protein